MSGQQPCSNCTRLNRLHAPVGTLVRTMRSESYLSVVLTLTPKVQERWTVTLNPRVRQLICHRVSRYAPAMHRIEPSRLESFAGFGVPKCQARLQA